MTEEEIQSIENSLFDDFRCWGEQSPFRVEQGCSWLVLDPEGIERLVWQNCAVRAPALQEAENMFFGAELGEPEMRSGYIFWPLQGPPAYPVEGSSGFGSLYRGQLLGFCWTF